MPSLPAVPPVSPYGTLQGSLFQYTSPFPSLVAFESVHPRQRHDASFLPENKCVLLGGLSDGLLSMPYTAALEEACHSVEDEGGAWSLVQPVLSSSSTGFGHGSLARDSVELEKLLRYLQAHRNAKRVCLVGHSTGCQNIVHLLRQRAHRQHDDSRSLVDRAVLQGPVSDREEAATRTESYAHNVATATSRVAAQRGEEMMPRAAFWAPITASRFLSLQGRGGDDDLFSSDLTDAELRDRLGHLGSDASKLRTVLVAFSKQDEYVPPHVDKDVLLDRLCHAMNSSSNNRAPVATKLMLDTGNHNLSQGEGDATLFVQEVKKILSLGRNE